MNKYFILAGLAVTVSVQGVDSKHDDTRCGAYTANHHLSFSPVIDSRSQEIVSKLSREGSIGERLYQEAEKLREKRNKIQEERALKEIEGCTFAPKINEKSRKIPEKSRETKEFLLNEKKAKLQSLEKTTVLKTNKIKTADKLFQELKEAQKVEIQKEAYRLKNRLYHEGMDKLKIKKEKNEEFLKYRENQKIEICTFKPAIKPKTLFNKKKLYPNETYFTEQMKKHKERLSSQNIEAAQDKQARNISKGTKNVLNAQVQMKVYLDKKKTLCKK